MGVDYYACNYCNDTFGDAGYHVMCECGYKWCSDECAEKEGWRREPDGYRSKGSNWSQNFSCKFCRKEDFTDAILLNFLLEQQEMTRTELIHKYKMMEEK